jgi:hypothetical protein
MSAQFEPGLSLPAAAGSRVLALAAEPVVVAVEVVRVRIGHVPTHVEAAVRDV